MSLRTIMVFPEFENMEIIDHIRKLYDPLAELVRPHITLVFPFESRMSNDTLAHILENRLHGIQPFTLKLGGILKQEDPYGNYLFLDVLQGREEFSYIHQILYANEFQEFDRGLPYAPHMTIGKLQTVELLNEAFDNIKLLKDTFHTVVRKVSVEMIGSREESVIVIKRKLG